MMNVSTDEPTTHCQHYFHDYKCDDHKFNGTDCSKCEFRHRTLVELSDVLDAVSSSPELLESINNLTKYYTV